MHRAARALIDLRALRHNLQRVHDAAPQSRVCAAIKADAYGHGLLRVAKALDAADAFAVACVEEAVVLREAGIVQPLVALQGFKSAQELRAAAARDVQLALHQDHQLKLLADTALPNPVGVWLKIDTGMHRLGFDWPRTAQLFERLEGLSSVAGTPRVMTHLACADDLDSDFTNRQLHDFDRAVAGLAAEQSIANSAAILGWPDSHRDWVRPGIMLYGATPFVNGNAEAEGLTPVMTLSAPLIAVKRLKRGDPVGYGGTWVCPEDMTVGSVAIGYGDGYPRHAPSGTPVLVSGRRTQIIGRVSMDLVTIDLRGIDAHVGDEVTLWGEGLPVDEVAAQAGTISYELLCAVGERVEVQEKA